ncbi:MAG: glycosyltransferase [Candidatus Altiarchaeales archaeon]|nr:glycosyltransferase [Candidatus Altiarchaeales archaeon]MBD3416635.1 glycosyltransferase [Candidatus Altiarchaeales archaeon]
MAKGKNDIEDVDIAVIISSRNNAHTIGYVMYQVATGLDRYFPDRKSVIINVDGNSNDGTQKVVKAIKLPVPTLTVKDHPCLGVCGKGAGIKTALEVADRMDADCVALIDSDLRSINEEWVKLLIEPTLSGNYDFVAPYYLRYKYDGTITNFISYPIVRSLFGKRVRQPIGGEFGMGRECYKKILAHKLWDKLETAQFGIDSFLTFTALGEKMKMCEAVLGVKVHDVKDPSLHLAPMFRQVIGSILNLVEVYGKDWMDLSGSEPLPRIRGNIRFGHPEPFDVDTRNMMNIFLGGRAQYASLLKDILPQELYRQVASIPDLFEEFIFDAELWVEILSHVIIAYYFVPEEKREDVLNVLRHLWMGRVAYYTIETRDMSNREAEHLTEEQALIFEERKPLLIELYSKMKSGASQARL